MARDGAIYACQSCGAVQTKWSGQCPACNAWNSLVEELTSRAPGSMTLTKPTRKVHLAFEGLDEATIAPPRIATGVDEWDRVCGGGVVPGSAILVGGDPGVGKSTLLLQVAAQAALRGAKCAYISGEEAVEQVRARAQRMGLAEAPVKLAAETSLRAISDGLKSEHFDFVVIDSIQTMWSDAHEAGPGSVTQVRAAAGELVRLAKKRGMAVVLVGHVTKEGAIAGPRVVEHMVDAVFAFEGERGYPFRILRGAKNRFGATDEIGVFEMGDAGLAEVKNPSALFLNTSGERAAGAAVFAGIEGSRPVLVEIQALVAPSAYGTPRRAVVGWDSGRLAMILAVLEARCGLSFGDRDVYLNVAGGLRISEPAADLAAAAALASSVFDVALPQDCVVFGEISLSGEVRPVSRMDSRLKEAVKLGFRRALGPKQEAPAGVAFTGATRLADAIQRIHDGDWESHGLTQFDFIVLALLAVSAAVGFFRGAVKEIVALLALVVAAGLAVFGLPVFGPIFRGFIHPDWLGTLASLVIVFAVAFVALRLIGAGVSAAVKSTGLGFLDRSLGLLIGLARGLIVLGALYLMFNAATPQDLRPAWITGARTWPLAASMGKLLDELAPKGLDVAGRLKPAFDRAVSDGSRDRSATDGYEAREPSDTERPERSR